MVGAKFMRNIVVNAVFKPLIFWGLAVLSAESLAAEIEYEFSGDLSDSLLQSTITSYIAMDTDRFMSSHTQTIH